MFALERSYFSTLIYKWILGKRRELSQVIAQVNIPLVKLIAPIAFFDYFLAFHHFIAISCAHFYFFLACRTFTRIIII